MQTKGRKVTTIAFYSRFPPELLLILFEQMDLSSLICLFGSNRRIRQCIPLLYLRLAVRGCKPKTVSNLSRPCAIITNKIQVAIIAYIGHHIQWPPSQTLECRFSVLEQNRGPLVNLFSLFVRRYGDSPIMLLGYLDIVQKLQKLAGGVSKLNKRGYGRFSTWLISDDAFVELEDSYKIALQRRLPYVSFVQICIKNIQTQVNRLSGEVALIASLT